MPIRFVVVKRGDPRALRYPGYWTGRTTEYKESAERYAEECNSFSESDKRKHAEVLGILPMEKHLGDPDCWGYIAIDEPEIHPEWGETAP